MEKLEIINEEVYQRIKKEMNKRDDYFTLKELQILKNKIKKLT